MPNSQDVSIHDIQNKMLDILVYFRDFCESNGLRFTLCGGTCLGAVRHGGFIPWDDDVDVFMLREDYEKLQAIWEKNADTTRYACVRSDSKINIHHTAIEIKDNNTTFINRHSVDCDINHGLMIDVIPLDGIPKSSWRQLTQKLNSMMFCCFNFQRLPKHKGKITYNATKLALGVIRSPKLRYILWHGAEKRMSKYGTENCETVASLIEGTTIMGMHFPVNWFRNPKYVDFEGQRMPVPADTDKYLTISFGDYMTIPPKEEQVARHDSVFIDLNKSYTEYKGVYYCVKK